MTEILIVEDNEDLAFGLRAALENEGYTVSIAADGDVGATRAASPGVDLIVLDLMLPGRDGYRVLRALRADGIDTPVLVLTAKGEEANKVQAFAMGADDYVTKPFGVLELVARVKALLRRAHRGTGEPLPQVERFGDIEVNPASRTVYRAGRPVGLAPREFDLLMALLQKKGAAASRVDLLRAVWGYQTDVASRTVDIHIAELRKKLEPDAESPRHIITVWKVGYRLER
jgi:two-component system, OmpR family, alkaline phosphatase synthesis response regulator PhoP